MILSPKFLLYIAPVLIAATGETLSQQSGMINIGLEGMMLTGAYAAVVTEVATGNPWLGLLSGAGAALLLGFISNLWTIRGGRDSVVVGTAINLLALGLSSSLYRQRFGASGQLLSVPTLSQTFSPGVLFVPILLLVGAIAFVSRRTGWGLVLRACGDYPDAVRSNGISVQKIRWQASMIAYSLAGAAGAFLVSGITGSFAENMTQGRGFVALAMVTFGRWRPAWVMAGCLLIGFVESLRYSLQVTDVAVPTQLLAALPYVVALSVLAIGGRRSFGPQALGQPLEH